MSFAFPLEEKRSISSIQELEKGSELAMPLPANEENDSVGVSTRGVPRRFTAIQKKVMHVFRFLLRGDALRVHRAF